MSGVLNIKELQDKICEYSNLRKEYFGADAFDSNDSDYRAGYLELAINLADETNQSNVDNALKTTIAHVNDWVNDLNKRLKEKASSNV
jgi:hypothetical protein